MRWRESRRRVAKGSLAGSLKAPGLVVTIDQKQYAGHRLAWFYVTGQWPDGQLRFRDGDKFNLAFDNLVQVCDDFETNEKGKPKAGRWSLSTQRVRRYRQRMRREKQYLEAEYGIAANAMPPGVAYASLRKLWICTEPDDPQRELFSSPDRKTAEDWQRALLKARAWLVSHPPPPRSEESAKAYPGSEGHLNLDILNELFAYDPNTGHFYHRRQPRIGIRADRLNTNGKPVVSTTARQFPAASLAWFLTYGKWPRRKSIVPRNGDIEDLRLDNLMERIE